MEEMDSINDLTPEELVVDAVDNFAVLFKEPEPLNVEIKTNLFTEYLLEAVSDNLSFQKVKEVLLDVVNLRWIDIDHTHVWVKAVDNVSLAINNHS